MDTWILTIKLLATAYVGYEIYSGESWGSFRYSNESWHTIPQKTYRDETAGFFWLSVIFKAAFVLYLWFRW